MKQSNYIQSLLQLLPEKELQRLSHKWGVDKNIRRLSTKKMLSVFILAKLFHLESYREIESTFKVARSTLADALQRRSCGFFEELCEVMIKKISPYASEVSRRNEAALSR